jgi:hypothetical protein
VNKEMYIEILRCLRNAVRRNRLEKRAWNSWCLLHDNATAHWYCVQKVFCQPQCWLALDHAPYSLDLSSPYFFLFPQLKGRFPRAKDVTTNAMRALREVSKNDFQECFQDNYKHWQNCVTTQGNYFEGNVV